MDVFGYFSVRKLFLFMLWGGGVEFVILFMIFIVLVIFNGMDYVNGFFC